MDGTDLLPAPTKPPVTEPNAIVAMRNALMSQPKNTAWVVATGTSTNIGLLFATFPEVAEHIRGLSIMGGAVGGGFYDVPISHKKGDEARIGNISPWAEFNIHVSLALDSFILLCLSPARYYSIINFLCQLTKDICSAILNQHNLSFRRQSSRLKLTLLLWT